MRFCRLGAAVFLLAAIGLPVGVPFVELFTQPQGFKAWSEGARISELACQTLLLLAGTLALAMPAGVVLAVLIYRTDLPGRSCWQFVTILILFVPLPLFASAWQATLGTGGWLPWAAWSTPPAGDSDLGASGLAWKPWAQGLGAAVWIHAIASLPWVILIVGLALTWVEKELEEDALTAAGPWRVVMAVSLPRVRTAIAAAALWVVLQTANEITITDMMQVRSFAEEVYYQFVSGDAAALARAVAVATPVAALAAMLVLGGIWRLERAMPAADSVSFPPLIVPLGKARWPCFIMALVGFGVLAGVPLVSLVWKAGLAGRPEVFAWEHAGAQIGRAFRVHWAMVAESLADALAAGAVSGMFALACCWLAAESYWFRTLLLGVMAAAWALPAPVLGIGLKETINLLVDREDAVATWLGMPQSGFLQQLLYRGPSSAPIVWASFVRFFPCAVALTWPIVRQLPAAVRDAARIEGAGPVQEFRRVIWPLYYPVFLRAALAAAILSLGEVSAGKLVETPGTRTFTHELFNQMHYGVSANVASMCLVLLIMVGAAAGLFQIVTLPRKSR